MALENHAASEDGQLQFDEGDIILVLEDSQQVSVCSCLGIANFMWYQRDQRLHDSYKSLL